MPQRFTNWARNQRCAPRLITQPTSELDVQRALADAAAQHLPVKVVGAGHSWSPAALTDGVMLQLDRMDHLLDLDLERARVTVQAGIRLHDLIERLDRVGLALQSVGSIKAQSLAGAVATATHGSGLRFGTLASQVVALRLVKASGEAVDLSPEHNRDTFEAAVVGLGALGVVTEITLQCEPAFRLVQEARALPWEDALAALPDALHQHEHVKLWWLPHTPHAQLTTYDRTTRPPQPPSPAHTLADRALNAWGFAALLRAEQRLPQLIPYANRAVASSYLRATRRLDRSDRLFTVAMPPRHREMEFAFPAEDAAPMLRRLKRLIEHHRLRVGFPVEARFTAAEDRWLSPAWRRASCHLGAYAGEGGDQARYFTLFEQLAVEHNGRPHWGKEFSLQRRALELLVPRLRDFDALRHAWDPDGRFENPLTAQVFGPRPTR